MTGAEVVALASIVVTGIATPVITSLTARRQLALQTRRDREDELRNVLEQAGIRLTEALFDLDKARLKVRNFDESELRSLKVHFEQLWKNDDRLSVRLGSHAPEVEHYRRAIVEGFSAAYTVLSFAVGEPSVDSTDLTGLGEARDTLFHSQREFFDAASRRIGPGEVERGTAIRRLLPARKNPKPTQGP
jgi:hypothetical protein